jgi:hypothetical protein
VVLREPCELAIHHVWLAGEWCERVRADRAADGVVPDRVVPVEAEVVRPLDAAVCCYVRLESFSSLAGRRQPEARLTGGKIS